MHDKNTSPVGWYVGSYIICFIELNESDNNDEEKKFLAWENTKIIKASSGVPVQWVFEGVTELLPIYEELEDGAEIMYREHKPTKLKELRKKIRKKIDLCE